VMAVWKERETAAMKDVVKVGTTAPTMADN
jgi:hypothetical protein